VRGWLLAWPCRWLGRVSFSLYLCHVPVLLFLLHTLDQAIPPVAIVLLMPALALGCAAVLRRVIEEPSQQLGKRLAARLDQRLRRDRAPATPRRAQALVAAASRITQ
jgi:peptidoglycan/LPS O-acetylase OafA/YrhL